MLRLYKLRYCTSFS